MGGNQGAERIRAEWSTTVHTPHVGILVTRTEDLNQFRKTYLVLADVMRKIRVLKEHVSDTAGESAVLVW